MGWAGLDTAAINGREEPQSRLIYGILLYQNEIETLPSYPPDDAGSEIGASTNGVNRRVFLGCFEAVANAAQRFEVAGMTGVTLDFFAQSADVDVHRARRDECGFLPHRVQELIAGEDAPAVRGQVLEQAELAYGGKHVAAADAHGERGRVDLELAQPEHFRRRFPERAQHTAYASDQFPRTERFGDVVIATQLETLYAIGFFGAGGQEDNWGPGQRGCLPDLPAELKTGGSGQQDIQQKQGRRLLEGMRQDSAAGKEGAHLIARPLQIVRYQTQDIRIVFHDEYARAN